MVESKADPDAGEPKSQSTSCLPNEQASANDLHKQDALLGPHEESDNAKEPRSTPVHETACTESIAADGDASMPGPQTDALLCSQPDASVDAEEAPYTETNDTQVEVLGADEQSAQYDQDLNENAVDDVGALVAAFGSSNFPLDTDASNGMPSAIEDVLQNATISIEDALMSGSNDLNEFDSLDNLFAAWEHPGVALGEVDNALADTSMLDIEDPRAAQEAEEKYCRDTKRYERLKTKRKNTTEDDIEQLKRECEYKKRKVMEQHALQDESDAPGEADDSLFVPHVTESEAEGPVIQDESADEAERPARPRKPAKAGKSKPAVRKAKKGGRSKKASSDDSQAQQQKGKRASKTKTQREANLLNPNPFSSSNVFAAAQTNAGRAEQPGFTSTNKDVAMKELIASIPEESRDTARIDRKQLQEASKAFGHGMCKAVDGEWLIKGMRSKLSHYQMLGSGFMREREAYDSSSKKLLCNPSGGLQCDAMGLGKTVMSIATIVADRFQEIKKRTKEKKLGPLQGMTTLIVAPASILHQWREEFCTHAEAELMGGVMIYTSATNDTDEFLLQQGVVLTTYSQVQKSYPKKEFPIELTSSEAKDKWWREHFNKHKGPLHSVKWRRVILDEATSIKNYRSQTSAACAELQGQYRWVITGTPAMNALDEFYAYLRFLRAPNCESFKLFKKNLVNGADGKERLVAFLRPLMLRRTHNSTLLGSKLLNLPTPTQDTYNLPLDELHYEVYRIVKERFVEHINVISRKGELRSKYSNVLTLLLRLRQFVAHPLLIQDSIRDLLEDSDFAKISERLDEAEQKRGDANGHQLHVVQHMRRMLTSRDQLIELEPLSPCSRSPNSSQEAASSNDASQDAEASQPKRCTAADASRPPWDSSVGATFGLRDDFRKFITELRAQGKVREVGERITCARCNQMPVTPVVTSCSHTYCSACLQADSVDAIENKQKFNKCARCGLPYTGTQRYDFASWQAGTCDQRVDMPADGQQASSLMPKKQKPQDVINTWIDDKGNMLPSAKTYAFKSLVLNWLSENPQAKIIVYTQFVTMMRILARICELENWSFLLYHGGMTASTRNATVQKFRTQPINIFFATLTTGGVGLNLTMATRVIMVDPWWNHAVEQQAFCRTYRRGQNEKTSMLRFAASGTVDEHILKLQDRKQRDITTVMGEEGFNRRLGIGDLLRLFGRLGKDEDGNQFIYANERGPRRPARHLEQDETEDDGATDQ